MASRIADSFQIIKNSPLSEWLITPSGKEGCSKEVPSTQDRAGKQKLPTSWCPFNTADWVLPGKKTGNLSQLSSGEDKWILRKKAKEVLLNSPLREEHNFPPERYGLPAVCDLFACMQLKVDKEKWLYRTPLQMWRNRVKSQANFLQSITNPWAEWLRLAKSLFLGLT